MLDKLVQQKALQDSALVLRRALAIRQARDKLIPFTRLMMPDPEAPGDILLSRYENQPFHDAVADALERVERGEIPRLILLMPPRHGKTELATRKFIPWLTGLLCRKCTKVRDQFVGLTNMVAGWRCGGPGGRSRRPRVMPLVQRIRRNLVFHSRPQNERQSPLPFIAEVLRRVRQGDALFPCRIEYGLQCAKAPPTRAHLPAATLFSRLGSCLPPPPERARAKAPALHVGLGLGVYLHQGSANTGKVAREVKLHSCAAQACGAAHKRPEQRRVDRSFFQHLASQSCSGPSTPSRPGGRGARGR